MARQQAPGTCGLLALQRAVTMRSIILALMVAMNLALCVVLMPSVEGREASSRPVVQSAPQAPLLSQSRQPIRNGVIIFYHIFKTGGTTIRFNYKRLSQRVEFVRAQSRQQFDNVTALIDKRLSQKQLCNRSLFVEIHVEAPDPEFPTLLDLRPQLLKWRHLSREHGVPLFGFTLLREPLSFAVSFFNMFHAPRNRYVWNPFPLLEPTEDNLRHSLVPDRQCRLLARRGDGVVSDGEADPGPDDCRRVRQMLLEDLDWVGTTERMQTRTLPLLTELILGSSSTGRAMAKFRPVVEPKRVLSMGNLTEDTKRYILERSKLDQELYDAVKRAEQNSAWADVDKKWTNLNLAQGIME